MLVFSVFKKNIFVYSLKFIALLSYLSNIIVVFAFIQIIRLLQFLFVKQEFLQLFIYVCILGFFI